MGLNAQTSVPVFVAGQVLTAQQQKEINTGIPVFATTTTRDAAFGGTGEKTLAQGQFCYLESTGKLQVYTGSTWSNVGSQSQVTAFTASGTFTPPTGVTYAIAHILAGGAGHGLGAGGNGGTSSVAFAGGTISATGGAAYNAGSSSSAARFAAGANNSGLGASIFYTDSGGGALSAAPAANGSYIVAGGAVTAGVGITVTVGAGGTAGTSGAAGGSGYVWIQYEV